MENLLNTSSEMLQAVSDFLGVTIEYFMDNRHQILVDYAAYIAFKNYYLVIILSFLISLPVIIYQHKTLGKSFKIKFIAEKNITTLFITLIVLTFIYLIPFLASPESMALENIYKIIGGN